LIVVLLGPDGSGKTTQGLKLRDHCRSLGYIAEYREMNFGILPTLSELKGKLKLGKEVRRKHEDGEHLAGMKITASSTLKAHILVSWYFLDYFIGSWIHRIKCLGGRSPILIFSRYYYDFYYQRSYHNANKKFLRFLEWWLAAPSIVLTIERDASEIYSCKSELTEDEIESQQKVIHGLLGRLDFGVKVCGKGGIEKTQVEIRDRLDHYLS
jgi:thymidylate kinase